MSAGVISHRLERIRAQEDPQLLAWMPSGAAVLGDRQPAALRGCCMLIPAPVVSSPNDLDHDARAAFFSDLVLLGDAVLKVTAAERINYLVLCNQAPELHGHCIPRFAGEEAQRRLLGPFEAYDFGAAPLADASGVDRDMHRSLAAELERLLIARDGNAPGRAAATSI